MIKHRFEHSWFYVCSDECLQRYLGWIEHIRNDAKLGRYTWLRAEAMIVSDMEASRRYHLCAAHYWDKAVFEFLHGQELPANHDYAHGQQTEDGRHDRR